MKIHAPKGKKRKICINRYNRRKLKILCDAETLTTNSLKMGFLASARYALPCRPHEKLVHAKGMEETINS